MICMTTCFPDKLIEITSESTGRLWSIQFSGRFRGHVTRKRKKQKRARMRNTIKNI